MSQDFKNRVAIVTGGASGIGAAIVTALQAAGARVAVFDLGDSSAADLSLQIDMSDADAVQEGVAQVAAKLGPPTLGVHSAGITRDGMHWKLPPDDWNAVLGVNLSGAFFLLRSLTPILRAEGGGAVVFIGSINGQRGKLGQTAYAASKAGLVGLARSAARELGRFGGRVNVVAPGMVHTPMTAGLDAKWHQRAAAETVLGRIATAEDIAGAATFLLSPAARHITGQVLNVDGGQLMG